MSIFKRCISLLLVLCLIAGYLPAAASAIAPELEHLNEAQAIYETSGIQPLVSSRICGESMVWILSDDGVLTISGTGEMENYLGSPAKRLLV